MAPKKIKDLKKKTVTSKQANQVKGGAKLNQRAGTHK